MKRGTWILLLGLAAIALIAVVANAQGPPRVKACATCAPANPNAPRLPALGMGGNTQMFQSPDGETTLQLDDGTCESGLGAGVTVTSFQQFDVPTQCVMGGLDIVAVTSRMNTNNANAFAFQQAGPAPTVGNFSTVGIALGSSGPCPATALSSVPLGTGNVITGTSNFWAGLVNTGFAGRDSQTPGNIWLNCSVCAMTQYSPTALSGLGLGGTWMIRVTVEDQNCIPVELMEFEIER